MEVKNPSCQNKLQSKKCHETHHEGLITMWVVGIVLLPICLFKNEQAHK